MMAKRFNWIVCLGFGLALLPVITWSFKAAAEAAVGCTLFEIKNGQPNLQDGIVKPIDLDHLVHKETVQVVNNQPVNVVTSFLYFNEELKKQMKYFPQYKIEVSFSPMKNAGVEVIDGNEARGTFVILIDSNDEAKPGTPFSISPASENPATSQVATLGIHKEGTVKIECKSGNYPTDFPGYTLAPKIAK